MNLLRDPLLANLLTCAEQHWPQEACGLILHTPDGPRLHPTPNTAEPRHRRVSYAIDPLEVIRAEARGEHLQAIFHTHCNHTDAWSAEDHRQATDASGSPLWPRCAYVVVSVLEGKAASAAVYAWNGAARRFEVAERWVAAAGG